MVSRWVASRALRNRRWFDVDVGHPMFASEATRRGSIAELGGHAAEAFDVVTIAPGWRATPDALVEIGRVLACRGTLAVVELADDRAFADCAAFPLLERHVVDDVAIAVARRAARLGGGPPSLFVKGLRPKIKAPLAA